MVYGIDLGTTNSLVGRGEELYTGLVASNVDTLRKCQVTRDNLGENIVASYKTNMSMGESGKLSVACSTIILNELAKRAQQVTGEQVKDVVVSVPAYFSTSQREAVYQAAQNAGLSVRTLINEPTAAALYVCRNRKELVVVYDLGGGTFDVTIVDSRAGSYAVVATDGIVLGGDDLDMELAQEVVSELHIPLRYRSKQNMKWLRGKMRLAKEEIQKPGVQKVPVLLPEFGEGTSYLLTEGKYKECVQRVFEKTVLMTENLLHMQLPSYEKPKIVFVGGSSNCPYLRSMVKEKLALEELYCEADSDYIVAMGVALYAEMVEEGTANVCVDDVTKRLCIEISKGQTLTVIDANSIVPCKNIIPIVNHDTADYLKVKLYQGDSIVAEENEYIGRLDYPYGRKVQAGEGCVMVEVEVGIDGVISISALEALQGDECKKTIKLTAR